MHSNCDLQWLLELVQQTVCKRHFVLRCYKYFTYFKVPTQMTESNFRTFSGLFSTSQKIMTYSSTIHILLTRIRQQKKSMDIKLPEPIIDAKTMLSFSTSHKLHHKKLLH